MDEAIMDNIRVSFLYFLYLGIPSIFVLTKKCWNLWIIWNVILIIQKNLANQWVWPPGDSTLCRFFALEFAHGICTNQHLSCEIMIICYCYVSYV